MSDPASDSIVIGTDGRPRCRWGSSSDDYARYHDTEWGRPTVDERTLFEKICLEGFQSGLSWITILRKRDNFRAAFSDFDAARIAEFDDTDVERLLGDAGIIRHRGKIEATINNAQRLVELHAAGTSLGALIWSFEPDTWPSPSSMSDVAAVTDESKALAKHLKKLGFKFVGPTTAYAALQAMGIVNDHMANCWVRQDCLDERAATIPPTD